MLATWKIAPALAAGCTVVHKPAEFSPLSATILAQISREAGMVWVNSENNRNLPSPFGGMKQSGIGRDGGDYSFDFYMETRNVCIAHGTHKIPVLGR